MIHYFFNIFNILDFWILLTGPRLKCWSNFKRSQNTGGWNYSEIPSCWIAKIDISLMKFLSCFLLRRWRNSFYYLLIGCFLQLLLTLDSVSSFVEDRLATLKNVIKEPELDGWSLYLGTVILLLVIVCHFSLSHSLPFFYHHSLLSMIPQRKIHDLAADVIFAWNS